MKFSLLTLTLTTLAVANQATNDDELFRPVQYYPVQTATEPNYQPVVGLEQEFQGNIDPGVDAAFQYMPVENYADPNVQIKWQNMAYETLSEYYPTEAPTTEATTQQSVVPHGNENTVILRCDDQSYAVYESEVRICRRFDLAEARAQKWPDGVDLDLECANSCFSVY